MQPQTKDTENHPPVEGQQHEQDKTQDNKTTQNQPHETNIQENTTQNPNVETGKQQPSKENQKKSEEVKDQQKKQHKKQQETKDKTSENKKPSEKQTQKKGEKKQEKKIDDKSETKKQQKTESKKVETKKQQQKKPEVKKTMKCVMLTGPKTFEVKQVPIPKPASGEVLIKVMAAPINPSDLALYDGHYGHQKKFPTAMGFEGAGIVEESGGGLMGWTYTGKKVAFAVQKQGQGSYSQFVIVKAEQCLPLSDDTTFEQGAMSCINPLTVYGLLDGLKSRKQKSVVLTAAASQLCRMMNRIYPKQGVQCINIVRRQQQVDLLKGEGAKIVLNSSDENFENQLKALTQKMECRTCFEAIGGEFTGIVARNMPKNSIITIYGCLSHKNISDLSVMDLLANNKTINAFLLPIWLKTKSQITLLPTFYTVRKQISQNLKSTVAKKFKLEEIDQAIKFYLSHMTEGKVLIEPWSD